MLLSLLEIMITPIAGWLSKRVTAPSVMVLNPRSAYTVVVPAREPEGGAVAEGAPGSFGILVAGSTAGGVRIDTQRRFGFIEASTSRSEAPGAFVPDPPGPW